MPTRVVLTEWLHAFQGEGGPWGSPGPAQPRGGRVAKGRKSQPEEQGPRRGEFGRMLGVSLWRQVDPGSGGQAHPRAGSTGWGVQGRALSPACSYNPVSEQKE